MLLKKTPVYVLFIDPAKAFDRDCHIRLFNTLHDHSV